MKLKCSVLVSDDAEGADRVDVQLQDDAGDAEVLNTCRSGRDGDVV